MAIFFVLEPPRKKRGASDQAARIRFVRDGFSWRAFAFGPLWMLRHRLWLALTLYIIVVGLLMAVAYVARISEGVAFIIVFFVAILIGLESATLRRWTLQRRRWRDLGVIAADDADGAERRFFDRWVGGAEQQPYEPPAAAMRPGSPPSHDPGSDIIGLFPEPGGQR
jgi:hypothetical protein